MVIWGCLAEDLKAFESVFDFLFILQGFSNNFSGF